MTRFSFSLRQVLAGTVLLAALPGLIFVVAGSVNYQKSKLQAGTARLAQSSLIAAESQAHLGELTRVALEALKNGPSVRSQKLTPLCQVFLGNMQREAGRFLMMGAADSDGTLSCSAFEEGYQPFRNIRHLTAFQQVTAAGNARDVVTEVGTLSGEPVVYYLSAIPEGERKENRSVAIVAMRLSEFGKKLAAKGLDPDISLDVVTPSGWVIAATGSSQIAGTRLMPIEAGQFPLTQERTFLQGLLSSGEGWLEHRRTAPSYGFPELSYRSRLLEKDLLSVVPSDLYRQVLALGVLSMFSLLAALWVSRKYVIKPTDKLLSQLQALELDHIEKSPPVVTDSRAVEVQRLAGGLEALRARLTAARQRIDALRAKEDDYQSRLLRTQDLAKVGMFELRLGTRSVSASPLVYGILGLPAPRESMIHRKDLDCVVHPEDRAHTLRWRREMSRSGVPSHSRFRIIRKDGSSRWLHAVAQLVRDPDGRAVSYAGAVQDVTDLRGAEFELRDKAEQLATATKLAKLHSWKYVVQTGVMEWSDGLAGLIGRSSCELAPSFESLLRSVHPEDLNVLIERFEKAAAANVPLETPVRLLKDGGEVRHVQVHVALVHNEFRQEFAFTGTVQDVTESHEARFRLCLQLRRLQLLRSITKTIAERLDMLSIAGVVCNSVAQQLPSAWCGYAVYHSEEDEVELRVVSSGSEYRELTAHSKMPVSGNGLARCIQGTLVYEPDVSKVTFPLPQLIAAQGLHSLVMVPLRGTEGVNAVLLVARASSQAFNSTDCEFLGQLGEHMGLALQQASMHGQLQFAYNELRTAQSGLVQREKLSALGQMAGGVAHDINNALSPAAIYLEAVLEADNGLDPVTRRQLSVVQRSLEDVGHTIARMKTFYSPDSGKLSDESDFADDLNEVVQDVLERTQVCWASMPALTGTATLLNQDLAPGRLPVAIGAGELRDALTNLVFNAIDAMPEGGTLGLKTRVSEKSGFVEVTVSDTGGGMSEETAARCLEPFFSTKGQGGTGLGLPMVHGSVTRAGGEMSIVSRLGAGTQVRLSLPVPSGSREARPFVQSDIAPLEAMKLNLLLVDDDASVLESLSAVLRGKGHTVKVALGGASGLAFLEQAETLQQLDAVVTDLGMPEVDGNEIARRAKELKPGIPVVVLTGWGRRIIDEATGATPHIDRILSKPPSVNTLLGVLVELLSQREA